MRAQDVMTALYDLGFTVMVGESHMVMAYSTPRNLVVTAWPVGTGARLRIVRPRADGPPEVSEVAVVGEAGVLADVIARAERRAA